MAAKFVPTVNIDAADYTILPGTFEFVANPVIDNRPNMPKCVFGFSYEMKFELDQAEVDANLVTSSQGSGAIKVIVTDFPTIDKAVMNVRPGGSGVQTSVVSIRGTHEIT